jgi:hypothetical protein
MTVITEIKHSGSQWGVVRSVGVKPLPSIHLSHTAIFHCLKPDVLVRTALRAVHKSTTVAYSNEKGCRIAVGDSSETATPILTVSPATKGCYPPTVLCSQS